MIIDPKNKIPDCSEILLAVPWGTSPSVAVNSFDALKLLIVLRTRELGRLIGFVKLFPAIFDLLLRCRPPARLVSSSDLCARPLRRLLHCQPAG
jgi:hypothetical protein